MKNYNTNAIDKENNNGDEIDAATGSLTQRFRRMVRCLQRLLHVRAKAGKRDEAPATLVPHAGRLGEAHRAAHEPPAASAGSGTELPRDIAAQAMPGIPPAEPGMVWRLLRAFPGDGYTNPGTRSAMRSGASMWCFHALANGLDPRSRNWSEVEKMLASSSLEFSTKRNYRSHIRRWFEWCDQHRDQRHTLPEAA